MDIIEVKMEIYNKELKRCACNIASYTNNYFRISFGSEVITSIKKMLLNSPLTETDNRSLSIFIHEYLHFIHNISTVSGFYEFYIYLLKYRIFRETVDINGICQSSKILSNQKKRLLQAYHNIINKLYGCTENLNIDCKSIELIHNEINLDGINVKVSNYLINETINIGMTAILEGLAYELMSKINPDVIIATEFPEQPYRIIKKITSKILNYELSQDFFVKILIISLQTNNPIETLNLILEDIKSRSLVLNSDYLINSIRQRLNIEDFIKGCVQDIQSQINAFNESDLKNTLKLIFSKMELAWEERLTNPFMELDWFNGKCLDAEKIKNTIEKYNICSFIEGGVLFGFFKYDARVNLFNAIFNFMNRHLLNNGLFKSTDDLQNKACIFYNHCKRNPQPLKCFNEEYCFRTPFYQYRDTKTQGKGCWYSAGICACIGKIK